MYSFDYAVAYLAQEALCLGLILIMAIRMNRDVGAVDEIRLFHRLSVCSIAQIVFEMLWMFSWSLMPGMPRAVLYLCCLSDLVCTGFIVFFWYLFVDMRLTPRPLLEKRTRLTKFLRFSPVLLMTVLDFTSLWTHWVFYLDADGRYVRGSLYLLHCVLIFYYYGAVLLLFWRYRRTNERQKKEIRLYMLFSSLLVVGGILQVTIGYAPFSMLFFTLGMFLIFANLQSRQIDTDALTKLNNHGRGIALIRMRLANASKEPFYLFLADIDVFKKINDTHGHIRGDEALLLTADVLRQLIAPYHSGFLSRFGGDEFLFGIARDDVDPQEICHELEGLLLEKLDTSNLPFRFTMSVGYALAEREDLTPEDLIAAADRKLYIHKRELHQADRQDVQGGIGRAVMWRRVPSDKGIPEKYAETNKSENAAQRALGSQEMEKYVVSHLDEAMEKGWIVPYLQPITRTITGSLSGAEALARWGDPVYGTIMPSVFVPALEKAGLIYRVDCFMYRAVCGIQSRRIAMHLPVMPISVNLSRQDFDKKDMVAFVVDEAKRCGVSRRLINLEITESVLVQDKDKMMSVVSKLREAGFEVWMDDFGSGYSSLIFLNDYTLDLIKLDMAFLRSFSKTSREIMKSTVDMAKHLGIRTLAEGVETKEHIKFLKEIGCDFMQGYYFAKPLSVPDMEVYQSTRKTQSETIEWKGFYDRADRCVVDSDVPLAVMEYDSNTDRIRYLFLNKKEREQLRGLGRSSREESAAVLNDRNNPLHARLQKCCRHAIRTGERVTTYAVDNSFVLRIGLKMVASQENRCILQVSMANVTNDRKQKVGRMPGRSLTDIVLLFDDVHVLNPDKDTAQFLFNNLGFDEGSDRRGALRQGLEYFCSHFVHPDDRESYARFANADTMMERLKRTPDGILRAFFRVLVPDEKGVRVYRWMEFDLLIVPGSDDSEVLSCIKGIEATDGSSTAQELTCTMPLETAVSAASGS